MNTQPASLIPADHGTNSKRPDVDNLGITQYEVRPGAAYLSGAKVTSTAVGPFGVPYWSPAIWLKTCQLFYGTAPTPWQKNINYQIQSTPLSTASGGGEAPTGQAPTGGVFTGVHEDGCA